MSNVSSPVDSAQEPPADINFIQVQKSDSFKRLKRDHRSFVFPLAVAFLIWYLLYVVLAIYAPGFMSIRVVGNINLGIVLGLLQFVTTFVITGAYVSFANRKLDPQAASLRDEMENGVYAASETNRGA